MCFLFVFGIFKHFDFSLLHVSLVRTTSGTGWALGGFSPGDKKQKQSNT